MRHEYDGLNVNFPVPVSAAVNDVSTDGLGKLGLGFTTDSSRTDALRPIMAATIRAMAKGAKKGKKSLVKPQSANRFKSRASTVQVRGPSI